MSEQFAKITEHFAQSYPPGALDKLAGVLRNTPSIWGTKDASEELVGSQDFTLVFSGGNTKSLKHQGSVYDYSVLVRERYSAPPTLQQLESIITAHGEPEKIIYQVNNAGDSPPSFGPIEVPYQLIKEIIAMIGQK